MLEFYTVASLTCVPYKWISKRGWSVPLLLRQASYFSHESTDPMVD
jgi:hypothetical protein